MNPKKEGKAKAEDVKQAPVVEEVQPDEVPQTEAENFINRLDQIAEDLQVILREGHKITTVKGMVLTIPPVTGRKEKAAIKLVVGYFRDNTDLIKKIFGGEDGVVGEDGNIDTGDIISFIIDIADNGYEKAQELVGLLIDQETDWVDENLLAADLVGIIGPFTRAEVKPIVKIFSRGATLASFGAKMKMAKAQMIKKAAKATSGS